MTASLRVMDILFTKKFLGRSYFRWHLHILCTWRYLHIIASQTYCSGWLGVSCYTVKTGNGFDLSIMNINVETKHIAWIFRIFDPYQKSSEEFSGKIVKTISLGIQCLHVILTKCTQEISTGYAYFNWIKVKNNIRGINHVDNFFILKLTVSILTHILWK